MLKERADKVLVDRGLISSRSQAKSHIDKGDVLCNGQVLKKAGELIDPTSELEITTPIYVGRGAFKLEKALDEFKMNVSGLVFMDVGASTGGFTEILLKRGAKHVFCIDVGHGQLAQIIKEDPRITNLEGTNIRELQTLPELADAAVMDLSFISIVKVMENVSRLLKPNGYLIVLIKPQFEAGIDRIPKDGVIKDERVRKQILNEVLAWMLANGWNHHQTIDSPIEGKSGNHEYLAYFTKA